MFKGKKLGRCIAGITLAIAMVITLIPQMDFHAGGVTVDGYPIYNDDVYSQIKDRITNSAYTERATVYGGIGSWFYWDDTNRTDMTHVYHNSTFVSSKVNLRPSVSVISADDNSYRAVFEDNLNNKANIYDNSDVYLKVGATFKSTKNKPSLTIDGVTLGGSSLSKKSTKSVEGKVSYPFNDLDITVSGASGTEVSNMWVVALDDTSAKTKEVTAEMTTSGLLINIKMDEKLRWANDEADNYVNQMYINIKLKNSLTGIESKKLKADFYQLNGDTITFLCSKGTMGDYYNSDFQLTRISEVNMPVISNIDFEVYGVRGCYDYVSGYDSNSRKQTYTTVGNKITYLQDVQLNTTPITDLAGNKVEIGTEINLISKNLCFDNVTPEIKEITIMSCDGASRSAASKVSGTEDSWSEDINRAELFLGSGQGINFSVAFTELIDCSGTVTAKLNVLDSNGKQVALQLKSTSVAAAGTYAEKSSTVLQFESFTPTDGMTMMSGYEEKSIQIVGLTGTISDKAGNSLTSTIPAPDKQIFIDVSAPTVKVEKTTTEENSPLLKLQVTIDDDEQGTGYVAGVLGKTATMKFTTDFSTGTAYNYTYKVLTKDEKTVLKSGSGTISAGKTGEISWNLHGVYSYAAIVQIEFSNTDKITLDGISTTVTVADVVGNTNTGTTTEFADYVIDKVTPELTIQPVAYTYADTTADVSVSFSANDYFQMDFARYQWTDSSATEPVDGNWTAIDITTGEKRVSEIITKTGLSTSANYKLWIQVGDRYGNTTLACTEVKVAFDRPTIYYDASAITNEPDYAPQLKVVGPAANKDGTQANTRVTVTMGDNIYVRIVKTGETVNVFDFEDTTWYKVTLNETKNAYNSVNEVTDISALTNYYGEVYVSFDAAYADLTPKEGGLSSNVSNGSYVTDSASIRVLYASPTAKDTPAEVHKVTFRAVKDATGTNVLAEDGSAEKDAIELDQMDGETSVIAGIQFEISLSNLLIEDWGVSNIDFTKSCVELSYGEGDDAKVLKTESLQNAENQTYTLPANLDYETGVYHITVYVYQAGCDEAAAFSSRNIVLDETTVQNAGLWEYTIYPYTAWSERVITHKGDIAPLEMVGVSISDEQMLYSDDLFTYYTAGASKVDISLRCTETIETYDDITVGEVVGFRFWNSLSNMTEEDLKEYEFQRTDSVEDGDGLAQRDYTSLYLKLRDSSEFPQGSDGYVKSTVGNNSGYLYVVEGVNTFYYQVKLSNGTVSEIRQFTLVVSNITPGLTVSVDSIEYSLKASTVENQISARSLTMKIDGASSMNGAGDTAISLLMIGNAEITHINGTTEFYDPYPYKSASCNLEIGDLITFNDKNDNTTASDVNDGAFALNQNGTYIGFIVFDDFGGAMVVAPEIGHEGDKYAIDETEWKIAPFNCSGGYTDTYKDDSGNKVANSTYAESYLWLRDNELYSTKNYLPELVDYDSISFTFYKEVTVDGVTTEVDYFTAPMVENYAEPNEAGYMGAVLDESTREVTVYIANPVDDETCGVYTRYKINYKDIYGNEYDVNGDKYVRKAGYTPYAVSSQVTSEDMTEKGIVLYVGAAVAGGVDAQYRSSWGYASRGIIETGVFTNGTYHVSYTDMFGKEHEFDYEITNGWDFGIDASYSTMESTLEPVTVTLKSTGNLPITVVEQDGMTVESNGTTAIKVTVSKNMTFNFTVGDSEESHSIKVDNIVEFTPTIQWSYDEAQILTDEDGVRYINGPVTAYIIDEELDVVDSYTGLEPSYTFYPGEETSYTFKGSEYYAVLGTETQNGVDLTVELPVELRNETYTVESEDISTKDENAPAVQIRAYAQRNGLYQNENMALQVEPGFYVNSLYDYAGDTIYECTESRADTTEFLEEIGWAATYRFQIEFVDNSDVKLFVKRSLSANAPDYAIGDSDSIDGVTLNGRILEITDNVEFTLFAVDESGNATAIPFDITNVGTAPEPQVKMVYAGTKAYVYVLPPAVNNSHISDFKLTGPTGVATETEVENEYFGQWYMAYDKNGEYTLNYSYTYKEKSVVGALKVVVDEIDDEQIYSEGIKWSANKSNASTSQDVTVQLTFNRSVKEISVPSGYEDKVDVLIMDNRVTVRYEENLGELLITAEAYNGTYITLELDAVTNIDKVAPLVREQGRELAVNGKSVTVTFITNEDALFREGNSYGTETDEGYVHTSTIKENGEYTYTFIDKAGNMTKKTFTVDSIVDTSLKLWFSTLGADGDKVEDPSELTLHVGDSIYVKANRASQISLNNADAKAVEADNWMEFKITDNEAGLWPIIYAVDAYGNTTAALLGSVKPLDKEAPVITVLRDCLFVKVGTDKATVLEALTSNIKVTDADTDVTVTIDFTEQLMVEGTTAVTYKATDSSGNVATKTGWLRLTSAEEPNVTVDGEVVNRDDIYLGSLEDALTLKVDTYGEPYSVVFKKGVYTTAQMKIGSTVLLRDAKTVTDIELPFTDAGYYTVCIRTQGHDEYLFIIYVE